MLHAIEDVDDGDEEVDVCVPEVLVVALAVVLVACGASVVDGDAIDEVVVAVSSVVSTGATAIGDSPTCESANPTICHVSTVAATNATSHPAAMRHEIIFQIVSGAIAMGSQPHLKVVSRLPCRVHLSFNLETCHASFSSKTTSR